MLDQFNVSQRRSSYDLRQISRYHRVPADPENPRKKLFHKNYEKSEIKFIEFIYMVISMVNIGFP